MRGAASLSHRQDHLWLFIRQEDVDSVKRLCAQDPLLLERTDASGNSALQVASQVGCPPVLRSLLNQQLGKKLLNVGNKSNGMTPLMQAAACGHAKCAQLLLKSGASPNVEDDRGWNALHHAAYHGHEDVFADILKDCDPGTMRLDFALNLAASQRHLGVCQLLLSSGSSGPDLGNVGACQLLLSSCGTRLGLDDVESDQDKEWLQGALGEQEQAHMNNKGAEKAMSQAASQAGYSEDEEEEEVIEDDGGESGEDELGQSLGATLERRSYERQSPNASWSAPTSPSPTAMDPPHGATVAATTQSRTFPPPQQHLSMPGQGVVHLPTGSRRAHPMYVRHQAREPYVPSMGPAPHARGTRSSLIGAGSLRNSLPILNTGRTAPASAGPHSPARSSMSGSVSPVNGTAASVQSGSINMQRAPRGGPMRPVMSAQPRSAMYSAVPRGATRPYSTNTFHAPSPGLPVGPSLDAPLGSANGAGSNGWTLHAFSYRGMQEGLLLDRDTCLVYWMDPLAQLLRRAQQEAEDSKGEAAPPSAAVSPQAHLVGKLLPGVGGMDAPQYGRIAPVTIDDAATIELSKPAMRCLRQTSPAAALLHSCTRPSAPNAKLLADLVPGMGSNQALVSATSLAVPLCAVLGILKALPLCAVLGISEAMPLCVMLGILKLQDSALWGGCTRQCEQSSHDGGHAMLALFESRAETLFTLTGIHAREGTEPGSLAKKDLHVDLFPLPLHSFH
ncbi:hypothetical protein DUNSADRAFT_7262 [Dunaliella salina]|uniref:Uncharacterized protein n=1 Tax=Dunaliella salina TaxID=3046 RepID=A0ABQ7GLP1_DUNSA|nr:hypothetical protein DUNSADRAFT_7262 [Dunaliella salina]|eukprot:KAF5835523.1 hypothetical protein DUNSADRAFT_7262 [Dunaliella salina]